MMMISLGAIMNKVKMEKTLPLFSFRPLPFPALALPAGAGINKSQQK